MKHTDKKELACAPVQNPVPATQQKQTSGDSRFDAAIDKLLKKPTPHVPAK
ncbi:hypothetical protein [Mucilaginibacter pedocola]|uniref:hypothetical protein n=1 Tax=Mucilaginibacter pedocola TaxID=1792845 RepID=UPI0012DEA7F3|nr:hypothetical protein [Mucilaginibacter pedocola]